MATIKKDYLPIGLTAWRLNSDYPGLPGATSPNMLDEFAGYDAPKMKFLFTVSFEFADNFLPSDITYADMASVSYQCKNATRPNISVNYAEVNSYNYRYKVATRVDYGTVTVTFYDDNKNSAHRVFEEYLKRVSPIANRKSGNSYYARDPLNDGQNVLQAWASLGPLPQSAADGLIRTMRVSHYYHSTYNDTEGDHSVIHYDYINPKIQQFIWDELDMSQSDVSTISATFVYDSVNITREHRVGRIGTVTVNNGSDVVENI